MRRLTIVLALPVLLACGVARAERPMTSGTGLDNVVSSGELKPTPEMWFYDQQARQHRDPKAAVRAKAEYRNEQRMRRIESMKWFGMSNSRPQAHSDPYHGDYSPRWVANPGFYPWRWPGAF
ncbi:MAG: hypothetical protein ABFC96_04240 [Thermoguttaceae bacterium]